MGTSLLVGDIDSSVLVTDAERKRGDSILKSSILSNRGVEDQPLDRTPDLTRPKELPSKPKVQFSFRGVSNDERSYDRRGSIPRRRTEDSVPSKRSSYHSWLQESGSVMMPRDANDVSSYFACLGLD